MTETKIKKLILDEWSKESLTKCWIEEHIKYNAVKEDLEELQDRIDKTIKYIEKNLLDKKIEEVNWDFDEVRFSDLPVEAIKPIIEKLTGRKIKNVKRK